MLREFDQCQAASETTVSCILVTCIKEKDKVCAADHMLILARGDLLIASDYFQECDDFFWRVSRLKCWSKDLVHMIDQTQERAGLPENSAPQLVMASSGDGEEWKIIEHSGASGGLQYENLPIRLIVSTSEDDTTATVQIWHKVDELTENFDPYEVGNPCS